MITRFLNAWSRRWKAEYYAIPKLRAGKWEHDEWDALRDDWRTVSTIA